MEGKNTRDKLRVEAKADCAGADAEAYQDKITDMLASWDVDPDAAPASSRGGGKARKVGSARSVQSRASGCSDAGWAKVHACYDMVSKLLRECRATGTALRNVLLPCKHY